MTHAQNKLKRTYLNRIGKRGRINIDANRKIKEMFIEQGISECEFHLPDCLRGWPLQNVHRHKRFWYYRNPELLSSIYEVTKGCQNCHDKVENNEELREKEFIRLRGK